MDNHNILGIIEAGYALTENGIHSGRERAALRKANTEVNALIEKSPNISKKDLQKLRQRAVSSARSDVGSITRRNRNIKITDREWDAVQAGAISESILKRILNNTDIDVIRQKVTPRATTTLSQTKINRINQMSDTYTLSQIANKLNIPISTVSYYLKGANE